MRILFDQGTPANIRRYLEGHQVKTAYQMGWSMLKNGDLLRQAEEERFDLLLTSDQNMAYQQTLAGRKIAIVVLGKNRWSLVRRVLPEIVKAVNEAETGSYTLVEIGS